MTNAPSLGLSLPAIFAGGVLTSLTPCIYPMIPIVAAIVGGQSGPAGAVRVPRVRIVALSISYVVGLAVVYSSLGLIAGLTGTMFGGISTSPWLYLLQANLLGIFALMSLDVLPVPVPRTWMDRAAGTTTEGRVVGAFLMGAISGLVAAPCGAPVMAALLTWVASTGSAAMGFLYLLVFSLGMSTLLLAVGIASGTAVRLPRPGPWMLWVKRGFAVLMLSMAEYYLIHMGQLL